MSTPVTRSERLAAADVAGINPDTLTLAAARGEEITRFPIAPGEREKPVKRLSGLDWLWFKKRITAVQMGAGLKYGDAYRIATDVSLRSASNMTASGGDGTTTLERRSDALKLLDRARRHGLSGHPGLIGLCDAVAGEGTRLRDLACGKDSDAVTKEAQLVVALDLLATHYGMI